MKYLKNLGLAALAVTALTAFAAAGTASASTMEVKGTSKNEMIAFTMTLESGSSLVIRRTSGAIADTCTGSEYNGDTVKDSDGDYTGPVVEAIPLEFYFSGCTKSAVVKGGGMSFEWTKNTEGLVKVSGMEITVWDKLVMNSITCKFENANFGTFTGVATGQATLHVNAVLNSCPGGTSFKLEGTYKFTSPDGLGIVK